MRLSILAASVLVVLSGCTLPGSAPVAPKPIEYPTTQSGSPAAQFCMKNGGQVSYEKNPSVPTMELIYCTPAGGAKVDAWQYMGEQTTKTGAMMNTTSGAVK